MMSTKCCFVLNIDDLLFSRGEEMGYRVHIDDLIVVLRQNGRMAAEWRNGPMAERQEWRNGIWNGGMPDGMAEWQNGGNGGRNG